jgi:hypothetical protein
MLRSQAPSPGRRRGKAGLGTRDVEVPCGNRLRAWSFGARGHRSGGPDCHDRQRGGRPEDPPVRDREVRHARAKHAGCNGGERRQLEHAHQDRHPQNVPRKRRDAGRKVEGCQPANPGVGASDPVAPRPAAVPGEVVQHRNLDGERSSGQVRAPDVRERGEHRELHAEPEQADGREGGDAAPAGGLEHVRHHAASSRRAGSGSAR